MLDDLGIDAACIVGHGMGGAVAQALALNAPARVTRLCLVNSTAFDAWPRARPRRARLVLRCRAAVDARSARPLLAGLVHGSLLKGFADEENGRHALDNYLRAYTMRLGADALVSQLRVMNDPTVAELGARHSDRSPGRLRSCGARDDPVARVAWANGCEHHPGATLEVIPEARHFSPEDAPGPGRRRGGGALSGAIRASSLRSPHP